LLTSAPIRRPGSDTFNLIHTQELTEYFMTDGEAKFDSDRRIRVERRSGSGTLSEEETQLTVERRSHIERRAGRVSEQPSKDQLSLFAQRIRRAIRDEKSRHIFGVPSDENNFTGYPDVLRTP
jgi:hypothetical protein